MSREETAYTVELIRDGHAGKTLLVVEHDMNVVFTLGDQISVLVYGEVIASGTPEAVRANREVQEAYLGEPRLRERRSSRSRACTPTTARATSCAGCTSPSARARS